MGGVDTRVKCFVESGESGEFDKFWLAMKRDGKKKEEKKGFLNRKNVVFSSTTPVIILPQYTIILTFITYSTVYVFTINIYLYSLTYGCIVSIHSFIIF